LRVNRQIRADKVRVISDDGEQLGIMPVRLALQKAEDMGLDLVEIAPNADPPVCKIMNYSKFRYQQEKKEKEGKKSQHQVKVKEIKIKPNIDVHDLNTKINHTREFIEKGFKVRVSCIFKGRELLHIGIGEKVMNKFLEDLQDIAQAESPVKFMEKTITTVIAPLGKDAKKRLKEGESNVQNENK